MKYFFFLIIVSWLSLSMIFSGCKKEPKYVQPKPTDTIYVDEDFKSYWFFPKGSWWVYKRTDTTAEVYDTVTVIRTLNELIYEPDITSNCWEKIILNLSHSSKYFDTYNKGEVIQVLSNDALYPKRITSITNTGFFEYTYFFYWPINDSKNKYIVDKDPITLPIGKVENVVHFSYNTRAEFWIAKDIGFVKYIHNYHPAHKKNTSTWELVNYHINK